ncbi:MAG: hypothetical protein WBE79_06800 [Candidatus Cybelea sp.]
MKKPIGAKCALFAAAAVLAACNSGGSNTGVPPGTGMNCSGPPNQLEVLFPAPGSRRAPPALANVYVATKGQLPPNNSFNFFLTQSNGASTFTGIFGGISKSQIPTPHATPSYSGAVYYASAIAGPYGSGYVIGPSQSVSLLWNIAGSGCSPHFLVTSFHTSGASTTGASR